MANIVRTALRLFKSLSASADHPQDGQAFGPHTPGVYAADLHQPITGNDVVGTFASDRGQPHAPAETLGKTQAPCGAPYAYHPPGAPPQAVPLPQPPSPEAPRPQPPRPVTR